MHTLPCRHCGTVECDGDCFDEAEPVFHVPIIAILGALVAAILSGAACVAFF